MNTTNNGNSKKTFQTIINEQSPQLSKEMIGPSCSHVNVDSIKRFSELTPLGHTAFL